MGISSDAENVENLEIVAIFERFDNSSPFEPIKFGSAIRHSDDYNESMHGQLTAILSYKTPYFAHDGSPIHISFGLGNDMTVNTILGMTVIKDLGMIPNFRSRSIVYDDPLLQPVRMPLACLQSHALPRLHRPPQSQLRGPSTYDCQMNPLLAYHSSLMLMADCSKATPTCYLINTSL